ncbi:hypothetical protein ACFO0N_00315 [Halobium salinum]|uniref:Small CPxCG-related zinc finger protein n=1 Tax=Halobium salinum TaxID=1364940 RepID=A0ABD5P6N6_9EURY|nr:hypothetical protein [Halobium salinum]
MCPGSDEPSATPSDTLDTVDAVSRPDTPAESGLSGIDRDGYCGWCGEAFDPRQWHFTAVDRSGDDLVVRLFCTEHCRGHWEYRRAVTGDD